MIVGGRVKVMTTVTVREEGEEGGEEEDAYAADIAEDEDGDYLKSTIWLNI